MAVAVPASSAPLLGRLRALNYGPLLALVVLFVVSWLASPYFLRVDNLVNIVRQASGAGIIALGMTFVIIGGGIDLSVGTMMAWVGAIAITAMNAALGSGRVGEIGAIVVAVAVALALGTGAGLANGLMITKGRIAPFIVTLGTMSIFRSQALYLGDAKVFVSDNPRFEDVAMSRPLGLPTSVWFLLGLAFLLNLLLNNTRYGRHVCAVGSNEKVAQFAGIRIDRIRIWTYVIVGQMVAVATIFESSILNSLGSSNFGNLVELDAIAAVVIGGTPMTGGRGSVWGTVVGAIILGMINNLLNMAGVSSYLQGTVKGAVIIAAVFIQRKL